MDTTRDVDTEKLFGGYPIKSHRRFKRMPGVYRVDPRSQTSERWVFKHDEERFVIKRYYLDNTKLYAKL